MTELRRRGAGIAGGDAGSAPEARRRLFFALWLDEVCRARLSKGVAGLLATVPGRWLDPNDWHVTLCFLGAVPEGLLAPLRAQAALIEAPAFSLHFGCAEYWREARVIAALAAAPAAALVLASALRERARALRLVPDDKPLRPHVTLARGVPLPLWQRAADGAARRGLHLNISLQAAEFHLAESRPGPAREPRAGRELAAGAASEAPSVPTPRAALRYASLARWPLRA